MTISAVFTTTAQLTGPTDEFPVHLSTGENSQQLTLETMRTTTTASQIADNSSRARSNTQSDIVSFFASRTNLIAVITAAFLAVVLVVVVVLVSVCLVVKLRRHKKERIGVDEINFYYESKKSSTNPKQAHPE